MKSTRVHPQANDNASLAGRLHPPMQDEELICSFLPDFTITYTNAAYCRALGVPARELDGRSIVPYLPSHYWNQIERMLTQLTPDLPVGHLEFCQAEANGSTRWQHWQCQAFFDAIGRPGEFLWSGRDVTATRNRALGTAAAPQPARVLADCPEPVVLIQEGRVQVLNDAARKLLGMHPREQVSLGGLAQQPRGAVCDEAVLPLLMKGMVTRSDGRRLAVRLAVLSIQHQHRPAMLAFISRPAPGRLAQAEWRRQSAVLHGLLASLLPIAAVASTVATGAGGQRQLAAVFSNGRLPARHKLSAADLDMHSGLTRCLMDHTTESIMVTDAAGVIQYVNRAFTTATGYVPDEVVGQTPGFLKSGRHAELFYGQLWQTLQASGRWQGEIWNRCKNGRIYPEWLQIVAVRDTSDAVTHYLSMALDLSQLKLSEERLYQLSYHDGLTGLANRLLFRDRLEHAMHQARRAGRLLAVLLIDIDHFKDVNNIMGNETGDLLLRQTAERLRLIVRDGDTVARFGGDEFAILLTDVGHYEAVATVAEKILELLARPLALDNQEVRVTASMGISLFPRDGQAAQALERNEFTLQYQPQVLLKGQEIYGVEALIRWHHPELGQIPPLKFIPIAEDTGLIEPIGEWVIREACRQAAAWQAEGYQPVKMAVNISARQLRKRGFVKTVARILEETGLAPHWLEIELTESMLMDHPDSAVKILTELKTMGLSISLDDFGTGYSSLSYLNRFPIDTLKIDRAFVKDVKSRDDEAAIARAIIALARSLRLKVVAEGVETSEQFEFLHDNECYAMQGYLFSPPRNAADIQAMLAMLAGKTPR